MGANEEFFKAVQKGPAAKVEELLQQDRNLLQAKSPKRGLGPVTVAAYSGQTEVLKTLLAHRPQLDIHEASIVGDLPRVKELLDRDPDLVEARSVDGFSPLGLAAYMGRFKIVELLVGRGADVDFASDETGFTALTGAISSGHDEIVEYLLKHGAKASYHYEGGKLTPLHAAIMHGSIRMVKALLEHGADTNARMASGESALALAEGKKVPEILDLLRQRGAT